MVNGDFILLTISVFFIAVIIINWDSIRKFFANILFNKRTEEGNYVYVCPRCGSDNLKSVFIMSPVERARAGARKLKDLYGNRHSIRNILGYWYLNGWQPQNPEVYICVDCDYYGICPQVEADKIEEFKKKLKSNQP